MEREPFKPEKKPEKDNDKLLDTLDFEMWSQNESIREAWTDHRNRQFHDKQKVLKDLRGDRKTERKAQTLRDARNKVKRYAVANFNEGDIFLTLTYKENMQDVKMADKHFKDFMKRLKYHFKIKNVPYLATREFQQRGAIHFHCLVKIDFGLPDLPAGWGMQMKNGSRKLNPVAQEYDNLYIKPLEKLIGEDIWKHGFVDIKIMNHVDNVGAYLIKYMTKFVEDERLNGSKSYLNSKGLKQPEELKGDAAEKYLIENNLMELIEKEWDKPYCEKNGQKKEIFTNSYENEYLGKINYIDLNKKRLNLN